jgi:putative restriction endonuclease
MALDKGLMGTSNHKSLLERSGDWEWDVDRYPEYPTIQSRNGYYSPTEKHTEIWPTIRTLHFESISRAADQTTMDPRTSKAHSRELLGYIGKALGRQLPDPHYFLPNEGKEQRDSDVRRELEHRKGMWDSLLEAGGPNGVAPRVLRDVGIYGGAQGVWVDKSRTSSLTTDGTGVTVGLLHTGSSYADDLSDDGVLYHYPATNRPRGRDQAEIDAVKAAGRLALPVFVITYPSPGSTVRDVHLGWVESWDDSLETFLITFGDNPPSSPMTMPEDEPFRLVEERRAARRHVRARVGQQRFKFRVFQRYGERCAVCDITAPQLLDAAHLRPKKERGSDDPRNGLVLCASHHRALDARLFAIEPESLRICYTASESEPRSLRIEYPTLEHLPKKPHKDALEWLWNRWQ